MGVLFLFVLFFLIFNIVIVAILFLKVRRAPNNSEYYDLSSKEENSSTSIISWLKIQKSKGVTHVDALISEAENEVLLLLQKKKRVIVQNSLNKPIEGSGPVITNSKQNKKSFFDVSNANLILYLGSFLVLFSIFVLVAFSWETFSNNFKTFLIFSFTLIFYFLGFLLHKSKNLSHAAYTFLTIGSISLVFLGLGLWNFEFRNLLLTMNFQTFWFFYSIILIAVYVTSLKFLRLDSYYYLVLLSVYSLLIAFSFMVTEEFKFRIVILCILNYILYIFSHAKLSSFYKQTSTASRLVNFLLDGAIVLTVLSLMGNISSISTRLIALSALVLPILFFWTSYFLENRTEDIIEVFLFIPLKILLIGNLFNLNVEGIVVLELFYVLLNYVVDRSFFFKKNRVISNIILGVNLFIVTFISIIVFIKGGDTYSENFTISVLTVLSGLLILPFIPRRAFKTISFLLLYPYVILFKIFSLSFNNLTIMHYILLASILQGIVSLVHIIYLQYRKDTQYRNLIAPVVFVSALITLFLSFFKVGKDSEFLISFILLLSANFLLLSRINSFWSKLSGVWIVLAFWNIFAVYQGNAQYYSLTLALYLGILALLSRHEGKEKNSISFEQLAYTVEFGTLFVQSVVSGEVLNIMYGIALIVFSVLAILFSLNRSDRSARIIIPITFLVTELIARLYVVFLLIPWWIYIGLIGISLLGFGVYVLNKSPD